uniref:Uncharacterized protein n=1 Tax=Cannabis sativa TaxID=3483 RepID=A0A803PM66_CANSA
MDTLPNIESQSNAVKASSGWKIKIIVALATEDGLLLMTGRSHHIESLEENKFKELYELAIKALILFQNVPVVRNVIKVSVKEKHVSDVV